MKRLAIAVCVILAGMAVRAATPSSQAQAAASTSSSSTSSKSASTKKKKKRHSKREPKQMAPTADRIQEIQSALARNGYYQGNPNGKWDGTTVSAMQKFQSDHGLDATGKLDALSLQKLGLGSQIAGVSAPKPITPASARPAAAVPATDNSKPQSPKSPTAPSPSASAVPATVSSAAPAKPSPQLR